jgi:predicted RNA binding protein YcfA (HicA-like mRNA interferase family)
VKGSRHASKDQATKSLFAQSWNLAGFARGSHTKWKHPLVPLTTLILSGHDGEDAKPYQEKAV